MFLQNDIYYENIDGIKLLYDRLLWYDYGQGLHFYLVDGEPYKFEYHYFEKQYHAELR